MEPGGSATVSGGSLTVDGARAGTDVDFGPGHVLEFVATFRADSFQHGGFVRDFEFAMRRLPCSARDRPRTRCSRARPARARRRTPCSLGHGSERRIAIASNGHPRRSPTSSTAARWPRTRSPLPDRCVPLFSDANTNTVGLFCGLAADDPLCDAVCTSSRASSTPACRDLGRASWTSRPRPGPASRLASGPATRCRPMPHGAASSPLDDSGASIGASSRYIQYRAELETATRHHAELQDLTFDALCSGRPGPAASTTATARRGCGPRHSGAGRARQRHESRRSGAHGDARQRTGTRSRAESR